MSTPARRPVRALTMLALLALSSAALADTDCARQDRSAWMPESQFREQMKRQGVQITKFRITPGDCYEIYGFDRDGRADHGQHHRPRRTPGLRVGSHRSSA